MRKGIRIQQVAVRHGNAMGRVIGWIQEVGGRYSFSYDPYWVHGDCPIPLDLVELPIGPGVWTTEGMIFEGPLALFGRLQPGPFAEQTCFKWLSDEARRLGLSSLEDMPGTPLSRLVWMSLLMTDLNYWGLYFDPSAVYPEGGMRMWLPDPVAGLESISGWAEVKAKIRVPTGSAKLDQGIRVLGDKSVSVEPVLFPYIAPLPGRSVRLRTLVPTRGQGAEWRLCRMEPSGKEPRVLRVKRIYMRIAEACGIKVVRHEWFLPTAAQELLSWAPIKGNVIALRRAQNGLIKWSKRRIGMPALPYPSMGVDDDLISRRVDGGDEWIVDAMVASLFKAGPPFRKVIKFYAEAKRQGHIFDTEEALRRFMFFAYSGTFLADDSAILLRGNQEMDSTGRRQTSWTFAPLGGVTPMLMPVRSKQAAAKQVSEMIRAFGRCLDLPPEESRFDQIEEEVLAGLYQWEAVLKQMNQERAKAADLMPGGEREFLGEYEAGGMLPMICAEPPNKKKKGRKQKNDDDSPMPDFDVEMQQIALN